MGLMDHMVILKEHMLEIVKDEVILWVLLQLNRPTVQQTSARTAIEDSIHGLQLPHASENRYPRSRKCIDGDIHMGPLI